MSWRLAGELIKMTTRIKEGDAFKHRCEVHALGCQRQALDNTARRWGADLLADQIVGATGRGDWADAFRLHRMCAADLLDLTKADLQSMGIQDIDTCWDAVQRVRDGYIRPHAHQVWRRNPTWTPVQCWEEAERQLRCATINLIP